MYPFFNSYFFVNPIFTPTDDRPPTIYDILDSMLNFGKAENEQVKIKDLAKEGHTKVFDFKYPLSQNIDKDKFETNILNHFLMRRIGYETFVAFKIQLDVKLNEIMPIYNKMFDALQNWDIFNDGETSKRYGDEYRINTASNTLENSSNSNTNNISDRRESNTPQNQLDNVRDGKYVTNYNYDTNNATSTDSSNSRGSSNSEDTNKYNEIIERSPADKISILKEMQQNIQSIYSLIYKDLESLFYMIP